MPFDEAKGRSPSNEKGKLTKGKVKSSLMS
jgi:hypothetical protein